MDAQPLSPEPIPPPVELPSTAIDPLEAWAAELALRQAPVTRSARRGNTLQRRLARNRRQLIANYRATLEAVGGGRWISPAGEWLIDNFHVIDEQLREASKSLPRRFYRQLPRIGEGRYRDLPRAFAIAVELVEHTDGRLDIALLQRFLTAYQEVTPLSIGELWAIPNALRHAFLDRLAGIAARVDRARREREAAEHLAADLARMAWRGSGAVAEALRRRVAKRVEPSTTMFATELAQRLRDQHASLALAVEWIDQRLAKDGMTLEEAVGAEHRSQAANQTSVGNVIGSMRLIIATDWSRVFESLSVVEHALRRDPSGDYTKMEFATRDRYRHVVERVARRAGCGELQVAEAAVELATDATADPRRRHVGYYLIDAGIDALARRVGLRAGARALGDHSLKRGRVAVYLGAIAATTLFGAMLVGAASGLPLAASGLALVVLALLPASEVAAHLVQLGLTALERPLALPKLDLRAGLAEPHRTIVAVPAMLTSLECVAELLEALEIRYLGNAVPGLFFALLTDYVDSDTEQREDDQVLLDAAIAGIERLEQRHGPGRFFLLHRDRSFSADELRFLGWERKRGKLVELNRLLLGDDDTRFSTIVGDRSLLRGCRYVITLDADTQLPPGTAVRLVGTLAHPLNRPRFDPRTALVCGGHAILQPRVSVSLTSARQSAFSRVFADQEGIDPYTTAVSDVYQDVFGEGSFVGKGIYDLRAFHAAEDGRVPEGAVLSHDLLEGCFARSGLVSDVELFDDTPSHYLAASQRRHRWIRGDWQISPWLRRRVPREDGAERNPLTALSRWKIFDNLRRSLVAPATLLLLLAGWLLTGAAVRWTGVVLLLLALPVFAVWCSGTLRLPWTPGWRGGLGRVTVDAGHTAMRALLSLVFLPHEAWVSVDAISRALHRMYISRRRLLEWTTAAQAESGGSALGSVVRAMAPALPVPLIAWTIACALDGWQALMVAPLMLVWMSSPLIAVALSRPAVRQQHHLSAVARHLLRRTARKTWSYFETFVTEADHFLPPDNYQEDPEPLVAHRTSPTNIGLSLLAVLSARELGYLGLRRSLAWLERTLATVERLEKHRGHLFNWYDTTSLVPLHPRYVSMVDSGNLVAALITVQHSCLRPSASTPTIDPHVMVDGLVDTLQLVEEHASNLSPKEVANVREHLASLEPLLAEPPAATEVLPWLTQLRERVSSLTAALPAVVSLPTRALQHWSTLLVAQLDGHLEDLRDGEALTARLEALAERADALADAMDFGFLYDRDKQLFAIGHDVSADRRDGSYYDLLASEARLGSFVAIARGEVPASHWTKLGRPLTRVGRRRALMSWSGSMFEYLMPQLLLCDYPRTLLDETFSAMLAGQIAFGRAAGVPWGVSEAAYNARDLRLNYQYGPFGVPGLGIKRGLADDLVVAPYATALALLADPRAAADNLWRLSAEGLEGPYGYYESIDYTPPRVPAGRRGAVIRAFMAHHQGMTLAAICAHLRDAPLREAFRADPRVRAAELLLQERIPYDIPFVERHSEGLDRARPVATIAREEWCPLRVDAEPEVQLLSNGSYSVMLTSNGGGYSRWRGLELTRWREDPTRDPWGQFLYLRDVHRGRAWSAAYQPTAVGPESLEVCFSLDKAELRRTEAGIESHLLISVATESDAEVRALTLTNRTSSERELEITSYAEVVLATHAADVAHPAFAKLFVETERLDSGALLAHRRPRASDEPKTAFAVHVCAVVGEQSAPPEHETSRERFLGRWRTPRNPEAITRALEGTTGAVFDPIFSLRRRVRLAPGKTARLFFTTAVADTREAAVALADKYAGVDAAERAPARAWTHAQSQLHYLDIDLADTRLFRRLAARLLYADRRLRAPDEVVAGNTRGQSSLWPHGISGDLPILLVRVSGDPHLPLAKEALHAHEFLRLRGLEVDLVVLNEHPPSYLQSFQDQLVALARARAGGSLVDKRGGIFVRRADLITPEEQAALLSAARVVLSGARGSLAEQLDRLRAPPRLPPPLRPTRAPRLLPEPVTLPAGLRHWNGLGGFSADGREYVMRVDREARPPAPWANVIANPRYGALVTESGAGYDWVDNAHENRLTEWSNDPVSDPPPTAIYLRDEDTGVVWSPTPLPAGYDLPFLVRHGQGYTVFESGFGELRAVLTTMVAADDPVRLWRLELRNGGRARRQLTVTGYIEWTLGVLREDSARHVVTQIDTETGALLARNTFPGDLGARVAFVDTLPSFTACTADRAEFLGRNGHAAHPAALQRTTLSGRVGAALDPCAAVQVAVTIEPGASQTVVLVLGQAHDLAEAHRLIARHRRSDAFTRELDAVHARWDGLLGAVEIATPDDALDLMCNRWLLYQVVSSRLWGRSGLYQSGGAYGFRDQLQDVAALLYAQPRLAREHLLRAASRQFVEGDAQHWWHPPSGRGVRTRFADDYLWLPFIVARYLEVTADEAVLEEEVGYLRARALEPGEAEAYLLPTITDEAGTLYEHCLRALDRSLVVGQRGLPLIGCGDWNDGMSRVGIEGRGESVWMAWFLCTVLRSFAPLCQRRNDCERADRYRSHADALMRAVDGNAWDGEWYLRAFFDDGTPLGSAGSDECRIDSIAQSWSVICGGGDPDRAARAVAAAGQHLVDRQARLAKLLAPPFDHGTKDPGYIKGYLPGVRENGGQYNHAAAWLALAEARLGHGDRAMETLAMINPVHRAADAQAVARYRVEPYVLAGDVWAEPRHLGRGGWSWYTGSASWMYRVTVESMLGLHLRGDELTLQPCIPRDWPGYTLRLRRGNSRWELRVENPDKLQCGVVALELDGVAQKGATLRLVDDGAAHVIRARLQR